MNCSYPSSIKYIMSNEICERFSFYGLRAIVCPLPLFFSLLFLPSLCLLYIFNIYVPCLLSLSSSLIYVLLVGALPQPIPQFFREYVNSHSSRLHDDSVCHVCARWLRVRCMVGKVPYYLLRFVCILISALIYSFPCSPYIHCFLSSSSTSISH